MRLRILNLIIFTMATLSLACGGAEGPIIQPGGQASSLIPVAPAQVLELDLPGCEDVGMHPHELGDRASILRHPADSGLGVLVVEGEFTCVGPDVLPFMGQTTSEHSTGGSHVASGRLGGDGLINDDPIPIINEIHGNVEDSSDSQ